MAGTSCCRSMREPSSKKQRHCGSSWTRSSRCSSVSPASAKMRRRTRGSVRMVGPMSKRKPCSSKSAALPPYQGFLSNRTTSWPRAPRTQAAARPPRPEPITATFMLVSGALGAAGSWRTPKWVDPDHGGRATLVHVHQGRADLRAALAPDIVAEAVRLGPQAQHRGVELAVAVEVVIRGERVATGCQIVEHEFLDRRFGGPARDMSAARGIEAAVADREFHYALARVDALDLHHERGGSGRPGAQDEAHRDGSRPHAA